MQEVKASQSKVSQTINLQELLGVSFKGETGFRRSVAQAVIDYILERTDKNISSTGEKFESPYSDVYANSEEFKLAGKSKRNVNLELTGQMKASIDLISDTPNTITIGITGEQAKKGYNHQVGDTVPPRPFIGFQSESEVNKLKALLTKQFADEINALRDKKTLGLTVEELFGESLNVQAQNAIIEDRFIVNTLEDFFFGDEN
jgi:hypothetical protein